MFQRTKKKWKVKVLGSNGSTDEFVVEAYWSAAYEGIKEAVGRAACNSAFQAAKKNPGPNGVEQFAPTSIVLDEATA